MYEMRVHPLVQQALLENKPVVALESTIISHGMPYPQNLKTARETERIIREQGCVPATIGILEGTIIVGLNDQELETFARSSNVVKTSRRDLPIVTARKQNGATTVASTMLIAQLAGIKIFVTGGIGGVHRNAQQTFDISADLTELSKTSVAVICAGAKSILDIGLTLEYLETQGVPVLGYRSEFFPAFYKRSSGHGVDAVLEDPQQAAKILKQKWDLGLEGGVVIANPIPEAFEFQGDMDTIVQQAVAKAQDLGIQGKEITPFLLSQVKQATSGKSLEANIQLVYHNAQIGAQIAKAYSAL